MVAQVGDSLRSRLPWGLCAALVPASIFVAVYGAMQLLGHFGNVFSGAFYFFIGMVLLSITMAAAEIRRVRSKIKIGTRRTPFGRFVALITNNPIMPFVAIGAVVAFVSSTFTYFGANNNGVEFFVETEPEQAIIYVRARGNLSLDEKDALLQQAEAIILGHPGVSSTFAFAGSGGLNANTGGARSPLDTIGQAQIELVPWKDRPSTSQNSMFLGFIPWTSRVLDPNFDGDKVLGELREKLDALPGIKIEILNLAQGPASAKPVHLRLKGDNWDDLITATTLARQKFEATEALKDIEDTLPLPWDRLAD